MRKDKRILMEKLRALETLQKRYREADLELLDLFMTDVSFKDKDGNTVTMTPEDCTNELNRKDGNMVYKETWRGKVQKYTHMHQFCYSKGMLPSDIVYMHENPNTEKSAEIRAKINTYKNEFFKMIKENDIDKACESTADLMNIISEKRDVYYKKNMTFDDVIDNFEDFYLSNCSTMTYGQTFGSHSDSPNFVKVNEIYDKKYGKDKGKADSASVGGLMLLGEYLLPIISPNPDDEKFFSQNTPNLQEYYNLFESSEKYGDMPLEKMGTVENEVTTEPTTIDKAIMGLGWAKSAERKVSYGKSIPFRTKGVLTNEAMHGLAEIGTNSKIYVSPITKKTEELQSKVRKYYNTFEPAFSESKEQYKTNQLGSFYKSDGHLTMDVNMDGIADEKITKNVMAIKKAKVFATFIKDEQKKEKFNKIVNVWEELLEDEKDNGVVTRSYLDFENKLDVEILRRKIAGKNTDNLNAIKEEISREKDSLGRGSQADGIFDLLRSFESLAWEKEQQSDEKISGKFADGNFDVLKKILADNDISEEDFFDVVKDLNRNRPEFDHAVISFDGVSDEELAKVTGLGANAYPMKMSAFLANTLDDNFYFLKDNFMTPEYEESLSKEGKDIYDCLYVNGVPLRKAYGIAPSLDYKNDASILKRKFMLDVLNKADVRFDNGKSIEPIEVSFNEKNLPLTKAAYDKTEISVPDAFKNLSEEEKKAKVLSEKEAFTRSDREKDFIQFHEGYADNNKQGGIAAFEESEFLNVSGIDSPQAFSERLERIRQEDFENPDESELFEGEVDDNYRNLIDAIYGGQDSKNHLYGNCLEGIGIKDINQSLFFDGKTFDEYCDENGFDRTGWDRFQKRTMALSLLFDDKTHVDVVRLGADENGKLKVFTSEVKLDTTGLSAEKKQSLEALYAEPGREERHKKISGSFINKLEKVNIMKDNLESIAIVKDESQKTNVTLQLAVAKAIAILREPEKANEIAGYTRVLSAEKEGPEEKIAFKKNFFDPIEVHVENYVKDGKFDGTMYDYKAALGKFVTTVDRSNMTPEMKNLVDVADIYYKDLKGALKEPSRAAFEAKKELMNLNVESHEFFDRFGPLVASAKNKTPFRKLSDAIEELRGMDPAYPSISESALYREQLKDIRNLAQEYIDWAGKPGIFSSKKTEQRYEFVNNLIHFADTKIETIETDAKILNGVEYAHEERELVSLDELGGNESKHTDKKVTKVKSKTVENALENSDEKEDGMRERDSSIGSMGKNG